MSEVYVSEIAVYPIKSCQGISVGHAAVVETGLELDREFMIVDAASGKFVTQRQEPQLAAVKINVEPDHMVIQLPGVGNLEVPIAYNPDLPEIDTEVHKKPCVGLDQGEEAARFFSYYLMKGVRLIRASREKPRFVSERHRGVETTNRVAFGDSSSFLLTSRASLAEQHKIVGLEDETVPMSRFRPNIVVDGDLLPYEEDSWKQISIGELIASVKAACDRCQIPTIVQVGDEAGRQGEVAVKRDFLASRAGVDLTQQDHPKGRFFGQNLSHAKPIDQPLRIHVGNIVEVLHRGKPNISLKEI